MAGAALAALEGPELVTQAEFARRLGRPKSLVCKWVKTGKIRPASIAANGLLYFAAALHDIQKTWDPAKSRTARPLPAALVVPAGRAVAEVPVEADTSYASVKQRREQAQAELAELDLARRRGELVDAQQVKAAGVEIAELWRQALAQRAPELVRVLGSLLTAEERLKALHAADRELCRSVAEAAAARVAEIGAAG